jgi:hypothetical protein
VTEDVKDRVDLGPWWENHPSKVSDGAPPTAPADMLSCTRDLPGLVARFPSSSHGSPIPRNRTPSSSSSSSTRTHAREKDANKCDSRRGYYNNNQPSLLTRKGVCMGGGRYQVGKRSGVSTCEHGSPQGLETILEPAFPFCNGTRVASLSPDR